MAGRRNILRIEIGTGAAAPVGGGGVFSIGRFEENIRIDPRRMETHRHGFHELMMFESGDGVFSADFVDYEIHAPAAVIIPAGTVHWWPTPENLRGTVIGFDLAFLRVTSRAEETAVLLMPPFQPVVPFAGGWSENIRPLLRRMHEEWLSDLPGRRDVLRACLAMLLVDAGRARNGTRETVALTAAEKLYAAFVEALEFRVTSMPSARDLAADLRVTTDHLSVMLRQISGKTAGDLIAERILLEAKRLLIHSRLGVAETGYALGFESPSYFTRFFRRHGGVSPKEFRLAGAG